MTVLDAFAVIAYLRDEPAAGEVRALLRAGQARLTAVGVGEAIDVLIRLIRSDEEQATLDLAQLGLLEGIPVDSVVGAAAGRLRARRYHRTKCAVSLADCIAAETARAGAMQLATSDPQLLDVCNAEGISCLPLLQSDGSRWAPRLPSPS